MKRVLFEWFIGAGLAWLMDQAAWAVFHASFFSSSPVASLVPVEVPRTVRIGLAGLVLPLLAHALGARSTETRGALAHFAVPALAAYLSALPDFPNDLVRYTAALAGLFGLPIAALVEFRRSKEGAAVRVVLASLLIVVFLVWDPAVRALEWARSGRVGWIVFTIVLASIGATTARELWSVRLRGAALAAALYWGAALWLIVGNSLTGSHRRCAGFLSFVWFAGP